jgi:23S rRNA (adenine2503-C2)-methyltransferase
VALAETLQRLGEPPFRVRQIADWKYRKLADSYNQMANLPLVLRKRLQQELPFSTVELVREAQSEDGWTSKGLFRLADGELIEAVLMRHQEGPHETSERNTVCVSSQAGCKMACSFCATGHGGWRRNLSADEIVDQVLHFARTLKRDGSHITNVVFMGMGEPLDNYDSVLAAVRLLNGREGCGLGARSITISTCGVVPRILQLAREPVRVNLAVSLAAATDGRRDELIPVNRRWPIAELLAACDEYARATHRRVSFEYVLIAGVNDSTEEAERLSNLLRGRLVHVNLIPLNPVDGDAYRRPAEAAVRRFEVVIRQARIPVTVRYSKGVDIVAGCGQLRAQAR